MRMKNMRVSIVYDDKPACREVIYERIKQQQRP